MSIIAIIIPALHISDFWHTGSPFHPYSGINAEYGWKGEPVCQKSDMWSAGIIMAIMLIGKENLLVLFSSLDKDDLMDNKLPEFLQNLDSLVERAKDRSRIWDGEAWNLMRKCLVVDTSKRISASQALKDQFFCQIEHK
eukprot:TRINITY_DN4842_c0_g1_i1.p2 TRINITY_DN4842_c0_g1~~TRINITY_DN4842_c0_g1_i1.p2  ORF type:complete len:139 (-),score=10.50 TRINITY_DN4842_c0_g1_i1:204-620(-)